MNTENFSPHITVRLKNQNVFFGPGIYNLMVEISKTGSVREAAKSMELSYSKAWKILNAAESEIETKLVVRKHGGKDGGKASLSDEGKRLLERYAEFELAVKQRAVEEYARIFDGFNSNSLKNGDK